MRAKRHRRKQKDKNRRTIILASRWPSCFKKKRSGYIIKKRENKRDDRMKQKSISCESLSRLTFYSFFISAMHCWNPIFHLFLIHTSIYCRCHHLFRQKNVNRIAIFFFLFASRVDVMAFEWGARDCVYKPYYYSHRYPLGANCNMEQKALTD